jgi:hypothetical protein
MPTSVAEAVSVSPTLSVATRQEIDHRTIKLIVGLVALSLASLTDLFAKTRLLSISASYYEAGWSQSVFIGFLFAIAAFLLAYNGYSPKEMVLSKVASIAALGIVLFPCHCDSPLGQTPYVHWISAAAMFVILAYFCYLFLQRARAKGHVEAKARATIYAVCGFAILLSIFVLAFDHLLGDVLKARFARLTFYGEATGLIAFGISWLTASRVLPVLTTPEERFSPFRAVNPE